jgi:hypothetical protein
LADFPASPTALPAAVKGLVMSVISGRSYIESFAKLGPDGSWEKMSGDYFQMSMGLSSEPFSGTWPKWGILSDGVCGAPVTWARRTNGIGSSSWPTATTDSAGNRKTKYQQGGIPMGHPDSGTGEHDIDNGRTGAGKNNPPPSASTDDGGLGNPECGGRCGEPRRGAGAELSDGCTRHGRCPQPGMGGAADGLPARLDFPGWPAGRGPEQNPWEPPRVVPSKSVTGRTARIKMLGNAVVPDQAALLFQEIADAHERMR